MIQPWHLPLLFATGLVAGFVDAIAGGGGLITLPVLLGLGFSPQAALGTNKLQATFGSGSAAWHYARAKTVAWRECGRGFAFAFLGAAAGTLSVQRVNPSFLKQVIPFLLIAVALYTLFKPRLGAEDIQPRVSRSWFDVWAGLLLGFYDGFFGPGTGTFWAMACMLFLGLNMTRATGYTKVMNFASNSSSLIFFLVAGQAYFAAGLTMGAGQLVGARFGSRMVIAKGTKFIRPIFITVVLAITAKLIYNNSGL
ncbi:MAG TPA: TSUP family transporter [Verrucomicrobiae bacterium]|nr:TSUP family transporter [Verrucomicrobiae bacterium]